MSPEGTLLRTFPHPARPFQNFVFALGLTVVPERDSLLFTTAAPNDHAVTQVLEMDRRGTLSGLEIPLRGSSLDYRGIAYQSGRLLAIGTSPLPEILELRAFETPAVRTFLRGDSNQNGGLEISDAVFTLRHLFQGGPAPSCPDAADANDDGRLDVTDPVRSLNYLFRGASPLPPPFPLVGDDPSADGLGCP
jgi:hypothetical protein